MGIQTHEQITTHPLRGNLFKTLVVSELVKSRMNQGKRPDLFYWRDSNGNEIDVIAEWEAKIKPIEIKSVKTLTVDSFSGLKKMDELGQKRRGISHSDIRRRRKL